MALLRSNVANLNSCMIGRVDGDIKIVSGRRSIACMRKTAEDG